MYFLIYEKLQKHYGHVKCHGILIQNVRESHGNVMENQIAYPVDTLKIMAAANKIVQRSRSKVFLQPFTESTLTLG